MNIPARYCTGYLGDIGIPPSYAPGDFAGWFEAYIGGRWYTFDPRNNVPRVGRILIAQGRDAADVPITQTFGPNSLVSFRVWTDEITSKQHTVSLSAGPPSREVVADLGKDLTEQKRVEPLWWSNLVTADRMHVPPKHPMK